MFSFTKGLFYFLGIFVLFDHFWLLFLVQIQRNKCFTLITFRLLFDHFRPQFWVVFDLWCWAAFWKSLLSLYSINAYKKASFFSRFIRIPLLLLFDLVFDLHKKETFSKFYFFSFHFLIPFGQFLTNIRFWACAEELSFR